MPDGKGFPAKEKGNDSNGFGSTIQAKFESILHETPPSWRLKGGRTYAYLYLATRRNPSRDLARGRKKYALLRILDKEGSRKEEIYAPKLSAKMSVVNRGVTHSSRRNP